MQVFGVGNSLWDEEMEEKDRAEEEGVARPRHAATAPESVRYVDGGNYGPEVKPAATGRIHRNAEGGDEGNKNNEYNLEAGGRRGIPLFVFLYSFPSPNHGLLPGTDVRRSVCRDGSHAGIYVCYFRPTMTNQTLAIKKKEWDGVGGGGQEYLIPLQASKGFQRI